MKYIKIVIDGYAGINKTHLIKNELLTEDEINKIIPLDRLDPEVYEIVEL